MIRLLVIIALLSVAFGCGAVHYEHVTYALDGKTPTSKYVVDRWHNAMDVQAASAHIVLADGTTLDLQSLAEKPDANVVMAVAGVFQSLIGLGSLVLKFMGL